ncbi:MvdC/MvdD family ATP grasp protein [Pelagerythrobacter sp.]|uniref:MvdC/MvdD family ATP grasp protein n=1 Tax=Pelagerythrobacter sp. TaxID=2800702 RepID=UPI0035B1D27E
MNKPTILIVTHSSDVHADRVGAVIATREEPCFRIDLDRFPRDYRLAVALGEAGWRGHIVCQCTGAAIDVEQIRSVWMRKPAEFTFAAELSAQEKAFADGEANHLLLGWLNSLDCFFMSHPTALRAAGWKCEQLVRARRMGFIVPPSIVANEPGAARTFIANANSGAIYKTLSTPTLAAENVAEGDRVAGGLHTTMVEPNDLDLESIEILPGLFQHYIPKSYEVRVTVVAGHVFAARIDSQSNDRTRVDFRHFDAEVAYDPIELPKSVSDNCRNFVTSYGLTYGAIDLIARPDGEYVFLENNPVGQFVFVEELAPALRITECVANVLIEGRQPWPS